MKLELYKGFETRPGTLDKYVVDEISSYKTLDLVPGDTVLDIGANIGTFSRTALQRGAHVIAVEPDPENFALLQQNTQDYENIIWLRMAVVNSGWNKEITLYKNKGMNKGLHSTVPTRGRDMITVECVSFQRLLDKFHPNKIKIDCEGAEYDFFRPSELPDYVVAVIIEYNLSRRGEQEKAQACHAQFAGWNCLRQPRFGTKAWATIASYRR